MVKRNKYLILSLIAAFILAVVFAIIFAADKTGTVRIDISRIPVEENADGYLIVKNAKMEAGKLRVEVYYKNPEVVEEYENWVLGDGTNTYIKCNILLVEEGQNAAYRLDTYRRNIQAGGETDFEQLSGDDNVFEQGFVARTYENKIKGKKLSIAMLYEDLKGNQAIVYPEEIVYVE